MRYISKIRKKKFNERISFDRILQLWFNYHFFFFQSLIFRGLKLRAFTLFISIKFGLKTYKFLDNFSENLNSNFIFGDDEGDDFEQDRTKNFIFFDKVFSFDSFLLRKEQDYEDDLKASNSFKLSSVLATKTSLNYIWMFFEFFFLKKINDFFKKIYFKKILYFKKFFYFLSDPDFFFLSFLKHFFIVWFFITKNRLVSLNLRVFCNKKSLKKCFKNFSYYYYKKLFFYKHIFFFKYNLYFKQLFFFKKKQFFFLESQWYFDNNNSFNLNDLGVFRRLTVWHIFFSFFLYDWLLEVNNFKNLFIKQDIFIDEIPIFDPSFIFFIALLKITPILVLKPIPMGSVNYDMPFPITYWRRISYATRWVINLLKKKSRVISVEGVVSSIINILFDEGMSVEKKDEVYSLVSLNRHLLRHKVMRR